jgi:hypothetical protein
MRPQGTTFEYEYLREFETQFKISLGRLMEETRAENLISCYCPFKNYQRLYTMGKLEKTMSKIFLNGHRLRTYLRKVTESSKSFFI